jgi:hypothetical protein
VDTHADPKPETRLERRRRSAREAKRRRRSDPVNALYDNARSRAYSTGAPFRLTEADITVPEFCPVLGIPLMRSPGSVCGTDNSPSLDRIVPELGYVPGNIAVISHRANTIKSKGTAEEHRRIADWIDSVSKPRSPGSPAPTPLV